MDRTYLHLLNLSHTGQQGYYINSNNISVMTNIKSKLQVNWDATAATNRKIKVVKQQKCYNRYDYEHNLQLLLFDEWRLVPKEKRLHSILIGRVTHHVKSKGSIYNKKRGDLVKK